MSRFSDEEIRSLLARRSCCRRWAASGKAASCARPTATASPARLARRSTSPRAGVGHGSVVAVARRSPAGGARAQSRWSRTSTVAPTLPAERAARDRRSAALLRAGARSRSRSQLLSDGAPWHGDVACAHGRSARDRSPIVDLIGDTPLVRLRKLEPRAGVEIWAKCEFCNPGGSVKDRAALPDDPRRRRRRRAHAATRRSSTRPAATPASPTR